VVTRVDKDEAEVVVRGRACVLSTPLQPRLVALDACPRVINARDIHSSEASSSQSEVAAPAGLDQILPRVHAQGAVLSIGVLLSVYPWLKEGDNFVSCIVKRLGVRQRAYKSLGHKRELKRHWPDHRCHI
jgi:hypothetical protein